MSSYPPSDSIERQIRALYDADRDLLKGRREDRAALLLQLAQMDEDGILFQGERQLASRMAHLHMVTHGGRGDTRHPITQLANVTASLEDLIRWGVVCGTCADEGERACNCWRMLENETPR